MENFDAPTAAKLHDQHGRAAYRIKFGERTAFVREEELSAAKSLSSALAEILGRQGLHLVTVAQRQAAMNAIGTAEDSGGTVKLANRPGWLDDTTYVHGLGTGITAGVDDPAVLALFVPVERYRPAGSHEAWLAAVEGPLATQHLLQAILCFSMTPVILKLFGGLAGVTGNFGLELVGRTSLGKTTGLRLAASVWGKPESGSDGFMQNWRVSENGFEPLLQDHCDAVLPLDEANLAGLTARARSELQALAVFLLDHGAEKTRKNQIAKPPSRLVFLSSSNESLSDPGARHVDVSSALRVRMPAINLNSRQHGILETPGAEGAAATVQALHRGIATNYGHAGVVFVRAITKRLYDDRAGLAAAILSSVERFKRHAAYDNWSPEGQRVCNAFALVFAAGQLARECSALPRSWTNLGGAVMAAFHLAVSDLSLTPPERILAFQKHLSQLGDGLVSLPSSRRASPLTVGFIKPARPGLELLIRPVAFEAHLQRFQTTIHDLAACGGLVRDGARNTTNRPIQPNGRPERVYVFKLKPGSKPGKILLSYAAK